MINPEVQLVGTEHARILQHEVDHLDGVLFIDWMLSSTFMSDEHYKTWADISTGEVLRRFGVE